MEFHSRTEGATIKTEDWWSLLVKGDQEVVVHGWKRTSGNMETDSGDNTYTVEEFMDGDHSIEAKNKLSAHLKTKNKI